MVCAYYLRPLTHQCKHCSTHKVTFPACTQFFGDILFFCSSLILAKIIAYLNPFLAETYNPVLILQFSVFAHQGLAFFPPYGQIMTPNLFLSFVCRHRHEHVLLQFQVVVVVVFWACLSHWVHLNTRFSISYTDVEALFCCCKGHRGPL